MTHRHEHHITQENEHRTLWVIGLTVVTMAAEIAYGYCSNSMALLADGYHMGTHALALGLTYVAYVLMRRCAGSDKFPHGTEKNRHFGGLYQCFVFGNCRCMDCDRSSGTLIESVAYSI